MPIIVNLDVMMAKRKMSLNELSEKVDLTLSNLSILKTGKAKAIRQLCFKENNPDQLLHIFRWNFKLFGPATSQKRPTSWF